MRHHLTGLKLGVMLATLWTGGLCRGDEPVAYRTLGDLPVMDFRGRIKPLQTLAIERVKLIHSRQTIKLKDRDGKTRETWGPVAAFIDWQARPEYWNDQEFILVEYLPLKRQILAGAIREKLASVAARADLASPSRDTIQKLVGLDEYQPADLVAAMALTGLTEAETAELKRLAQKLLGDHKWLSPSDLENAEFVVEGEPASLLTWAESLELKKRRMAGPEMGGAPPRLADIEEKAIEVAERLQLYLATRDGNRGDDLQLDINVLPRPTTMAYLNFTRDVFERSDHGNFSDLNPLEWNTAMVLLVYSKFKQTKDRGLPGELSEAKQAELEDELADVRDEERKKHQEFNARFTEWLTNNAAWVPLRIVLESDVDQLDEGGFPKERILALRQSFAALLEAERKAPGKLPLAAAQQVVATSRELGNELGVYPPPAKMALESHYNRFGPFYKAPMLFGFAALCLLVSLGIAADATDSLARFSRGLYAAGLAGFVGGIALTAYGFYLRIRITGWAPVATMEETVVWVAMISALIGLILELVSRQKFAALAGSCVAMLATILAANVPMLEPQIRALNPVLRSNYWLTVHVLSIVSSYAAFALALSLGLLAIGFFLTCTYRRTASMAEMVAPAAPGLLLLTTGLLGLMGRSRGWLPGALDTPIGLYASVTFVGLGLFGAACGAFALFGELCNRRPRLATAIGVAILAVALPAMLLGMTERGPRQLASTPFLYGSWVSVIVGLSWLLLGLFGDQARRILNRALAQEHEHDQAVEAYRSVSGVHAVAAMGSLNGGGVATLTRDEPRLDGFDLHDLSPAVRAATIQQTAGRIKPLTGFIYRAMQVGVLLCAAGTILGGVWADESWGRFWGWDPKEVWALITLLIYLVPLHGRFTGWVNNFGLVMASVACFLSVLMAWYGVNFVLGVGLHSYGFSEAGGQGIVGATCAAVLGVAAAAAWRRWLSSRPLAKS